MKNLFALFLATMVWACSSSGSKESVVQDSTSMSVNDTLDVPAIPDEEPVETEQEVVSDTSQLEITYDETAGLVFERHDLLYTVSVSTSQYEASSSVTWYFDADIAPLYFKEGWSAEGNEGSTEYFLSEDGNVKCAYSEENSTIVKWCRNTGGTRTTINDESGDVTTELLPIDYSTNFDVEVSRYLNTLNAILKEAEITQEDENSYTLRIENVALVGGMEVDESTEVTIPKKVYEGLKN